MNQQQNNIQPTKQGVPVMLVAQPIDEDGVNLVELFHTLTGYKLVIAICTVVVTTMGLIYALTTPPVYRAETILLPPSIHDTAELQKADRYYTPDAVFQMFKSRLTSREVRRDFFLHHGVIEQLNPSAKTTAEQRVAFASFNNSFEYMDNKLSLEGADADKIAEWLNEFVTLTAHSTLKEIIADMKSTIGIQRITIQRQIEGALKSAETRRNSAIQQLKEALSIAKKLEATNPLLLMPNNKVAKEGTNPDITIASSNAPLYLRGTRLLQAELDNLQQQKDLKAYALGLPELETKQFALTDININTDLVRVVRVDEAAIAPLRPIKPQRKLIVLGSLAAGLLLGILIAMISAALSRNREEH